MSKLPNADRAVIPAGKLAGYSLDPEHPNGKHKARVFKAALGLTADDAPFLHDKVMEAARTQEATPQAPNAFGERWVVDFGLTTEAGTATVRTAWIVRKGEDFPRLTSCYVIEDK